MEYWGLEDLEPVVGKLFDRHMQAAREWFPHELVPWERAVNLVPCRPWDPSMAPHIGEGVRSAIFVNLLTEDNLPYYTRSLALSFGVEGAWGAWMRRWTAEEGRHSIALRDWAVVSQVLDPVALERGRMQQVSTGVAPEPWDMAEPWAPLATLVYVALQELATRIAHFNTAKAINDDAGYRLMKRVAADENLHFLFYRDLSAAAFELLPSAMLEVLEKVVLSFAMPGTGISNYASHTAAIANEGIYSLLLYHDQVLVPSLRFWGVEELTGLDDNAERARDRLFRHAERVRRVAGRFEEQRLENAPAAGRPLVGRTGQVGRPPA